MVKMTREAEHLDEWDQPTVGFGFSSVVCRFFVRILGTM